MALTCLSGLGFKVFGKKRVCPEEENGENGLK